MRASEKSIEFITFEKKPLKDELSIQVKLKNAEFDDKTGIFLYLFFDTDPSRLIDRVEKEDFDEGMMINKEFYSDLHDTFHRSSQEYNERLELHSNICTIHYPLHGRQFRFFIATIALGEIPPDARLEDWTTWFRHIYAYLIIGSETTVINTLLQEETFTIISTMTSSHPTFSTYEITNTIKTPMTERNVIAPILLVAIGGLLVISILRKAKNAVR